MGQYIIVDSGCPRSLMGDKEFDKLKESLKLESKHVKEERFKFGPSRIYVSKVKAIVPLELGDNVTVKVEFFVVKGNIPILLGNDIMVPLGGKLHLDLNKLELKKLGKEILLEKTPGGHFIIPVKSVTNTLDNSEPFDDSMEVRNVNGTEADAVMLTLLANIESDTDLESLHDLVGHKIFVTLALTDKEEARISKVHRYFGHRSARRVWELFAKANHLRGKRRAVLDFLSKCKVCSELKKSPPRP